MRKLGLSLFLLSLVILSHAASRPELAVNNIEKSLFKNANAIIRLAEETHEILGPEKVSISKTFVVTILNAKAEESLKFSTAYYGADSKVVDMEAYLYDKWGNELDKARNKDIGDQAISDGFSVFNDTRVKYVSFDHSNYPFTLEFSTKTIEYNTFTWPTWRPLTHDNVAVEKSIFSIIYPDGQNVQFQENLEGLGDFDRTQNGNSITWTVSNKKAYVDEVLGPSIRNQLPNVAVNIGAISYDGNTGDLSTWAGFGEFYYSLNKNRDAVPEELASKLKTLVADATTTEEKARLIYKYLQNNTRYVSVQLGIGGLQCFPAEHVAKNGFGDCKALSNYMKSLLKVVDISSNYILIQADPKPVTVDAEFPQDPFNHVILALPQPQDTIWLECTSQQIPFGYIGRSNMNRQVLWIEDNGKSKLVRTPGFKPEDHVMNTRAHLKLDEEGNGSVEVTVNTTGFQHEGFRGLSDYTSGEEQKQVFQERIVRVPGSFVLEDYEVLAEDNAPEARVSYSVTATNLAKTSNSRMFLTPALLEGIQIIPKKYEQRKQPLVLQTGFYDDTKVTFIIPPGYEVEAMPESMKVENQFGWFETTYELNGNTFTYSRKYSRNSGTYPKEDYSKYRLFQKEIASSDKEKVVFKKTAN